MLRGSPGLAHAGGAARVCIGPWGLGRRRVLGDLLRVEGLEFRMKVCGT